MTRCHSYILQGLVLFFLTGLSTPRSVDEISDRRLQANTTAAPTTATIFPVVEPVTDGAQAREALDQALALWISSGIMAYELGFQRVCECTEEEYLAPYISKVENGVLVEVRNINGTFVDPGSSLFQDAYSVEILFERLETALEENVYEIRVDYDATYGYPTSVYIDYDANMADEELMVVIDSFQRMDGNQTTTSSPTPNGAPQEALDEAMARWEVWNRENRACTQITSDDLFMSQKNLTSVEAFFERIQKALDDEADVIQVMYDETKGNPLSVFIDYNVDVKGEEEDVVAAIVVIVEGETAGESFTCESPESGPSDSSSSSASPFEGGAVLFSSVATLMMMMIALLI